MIFVFVLCLSITKQILTGHAANGKSIYHKNEVAQFGLHIL